MAEEKRFENRIKKFLKEESCWSLKYWAGGGFTKSGVPDLLICCNGFFLGVEVKAEKGRPSPLQIRELKRIRAAGGIGILLYPEDFEDFRALIGYIRHCQTKPLLALVKMFERKVDEYELI